MAIENLLAMINSDKDDLTIASEYFKARLLQGLSDDD